MKMKFFRALFL